VLFGAMAFGETETDEFFMRKAEGAKKWKVTVLAIIVLLVSGAFTMGWFHKEVIDVFKPSSGSPSPTIINITSMLKPMLGRCSQFLWTRNQTSTFFLEAENTTNTTSSTELNDVWLCAPEAVVDYEAAEFLLRVSPQSSSTANDMFVTDTYSITINIVTGELSEIVGWYNQTCGDVNSVRGLCYMMFPTLLSKSILRLNGTVAREGCQVLTMGFNASFGYSEHILLGKVADDVEMGLDGPRYPSRSYSECGTALVLHDSYNISGNNPQAYDSIVFKTVVVSNTGAYEQAELASQHMNSLFGVNFTVLSSLVFVPQAATIYQPTVSYDIMLQRFLSMKKVDMLNASGCAVDANNTFFPDIANDAAASDGILSRRDANLLVDRNDKMASVPIGITTIELIQITQVAGPSLAACTNNSSTTISLSSGYAVSSTYLQAFGMKMLVWTTGIKTFGSVQLLQVEQSTYRNTINLLDTCWPSPIGVPLCFTFRITLSYGIAVSFDSNSGSVTLRIGPSFGISVDLSATVSLWVVQAGFAASGVVTGLALPIQVSFPSTTTACAAVKEIHALVDLLQTVNMTLFAEELTTAFASIPSLINIALNFTDSLTQSLGIMNASIAAMIRSPHAQAALSQVFDPTSAIRNATKEFLQAVTTAYNQNYLEVSRILNNTSTIQKVWNITEQVTTKVAPAVAASKAPTCFRIDAVVTPTNIEYGIFLQWMSCKCRWCCWCKCKWGGRSWLVSGSVRNNGGSSLLVSGGDSSSCSTALRYP